jgi:hypothetical protein
MRRAKNYTGSSSSGKRLSAALRQKPPEQIQNPDTFGDTSDAFGASSGKGLRRLSTERLVGNDPPQ